MAVDFATLFLSGLGGLGRGIIQKNQMDAQREQQQQLFDFREQRAKNTDDDQAVNFLTGIYDKAVSTGNQQLGDMAAGELSKITGKPITFQLKPTAPKESMFDLPKDTGAKIYEMFPNLKPFAGQGLDLNKNLSALLNSASRTNKQREGAPAKEIDSVEKKMKAVMESIQQLITGRFGDQDMLVNQGKEDEYKRRLDQYNRLLKRRNELLGVQDTPPPANDPTKINSKADVRNAVRGQGISLPDPQQYPTAVNPTTGERLILKDGKWQKAN